MADGACVGCGEPLLPGAARGRRARNHGAACRQRARRARLHVERGQAWEALERVDAATVAARHAMTASAVPHEAIRTLVAAVSDLASCTVLPEAAEHDAGEPSDTERAKEKVTEIVTNDAPCSSIGREELATDATPEAPKSQPPHIGPREMLDVDTVRLERGREPRTWTVLAGHGDSERLVGFLSPHGIKQKQWDAFSPGWTRVVGGPWRTRQDATIRLIEPHVPRRRMR
jgi:hypothetical protein